jgi:hypothetical protein
LLGTHPGRILRRLNLLAVVALDSRSMSRGSR